MDKIIITDLETSGIIGVKPPEREHPQTILINLILEADLRPTGETDSVEFLINYSTVAKFVIAEVASSRFYTVEALASHLAKGILSQFDVDVVRIRLEKLKAVTHAARVGVELKRSRNDLES